MSAPIQPPAAAIWLGATALALLLAYLFTSARRQRAQLEHTARTALAGERRFRALLEAAPDATITVTEDGRIALVNSQTEALFGYRRDELIGQPIELLMPESLRAGHVAHRREFHAQPRRRPMGVGLDLVARRKDGTEFPTEISLSPLQTADGPAVIVVVRDISERKGAEAARAALVREQAARTEAEAASRAKDDFVAVVSHELRTPLNAILGWASLLRSGALEADVATHALGAIERSAHAQRQLVDDLLDVSRMITGKISLDVQRVDLARIVSQAIDTVRPAIESKRQRLDVVIDPQLPAVRGDAGRLQQVAWNLLANAVKFTPEHGSIRVAATAANEVVQVQVADTGVGIDPGFLPHVFERFTQRDSSSTRAYGGLGLGLAIVRQLVELHGGTVRADSAGPGCGATFTVSLPAATGRRDQDGQPAVDGQARDAGTPDLQEVRVLAGRGLR